MLYIIVTTTLQHNSCNIITLYIIVTTTLQHNSCNIITLSSSERDVVFGSFVTIPRDYNPTWFKLHDACQTGGMALCESEKTKKAK